METKSELDVVKEEVRNLAELVAQCIEVSNRRTEQVGVELGKICEKDDALEMANGRTYVLEGRLDILRRKVEHLESVIEVISQALKEKGFNIADSVGDA